MNVNIKGVINNSTVDPNKILPMRYAWARQHYKDGVANNWTPEEISMSRLEICKSCEWFRKNTQTCKKCGCFMKLKTTLEKAKCPIGKW